MLPLEFDGWDESDLAVRAPVVEPVDVLRDGELEVIDAAPRSSVTQQLGLEERVERLGEGVLLPRCCHDSHPSVE